MMRRLPLLALLLSVAAFARFTAHPTRSCEAYNNLKHTTNTHHVRLDTTTDYTVLKRHKGQMLVKIPDESPATRWVDDNCFGEKKSVASTKSQRKEYPRKKKHFSRTKPVTRRQNLLILSWQNTFCEGHRHTRECKMLTRERKNLLGLHGLWPQPRSKSYCNVPRKIVARDKHHQWRALPEPKLSSQTAVKLKAIMPGYSSALHHHEWIKHGTCYGTDADQYYSDAARWTVKISDGSIGRVLQNNIGKRITLKQLRDAVEKDFGKGAGDRLDLRCDHGKISELWIHLGGDAPDLEARIKAGSRTHSRCQGGIVDAPGYQ